MVSRAEAPGPPALGGRHPALERRARDVLAHVRCAPAARAPPARPALSPPAGELRGARRGLKMEEEGGAVPPPAPPPPAPS